MDDMWNLPRSIELGGEQYEVRTDFRAILDILRAMADPELNEEDRIEVLFDIFFLDAEEIPQEYLQEAIHRARPRNGQQKKRQLLRNYLD